MATLVYAPGIQVIIESSKARDPQTGRQATSANPVLIDVTDDLVEGQMVRRSDGVSTFDFSLNNARRKYDNVFAPNDRLYVMMKRFTWMRTFTGYLNNVPIFAAWPGVVSLTSSCSLKRLQYFYWDSALQASQALIRQHIMGGAQINAADGGIRNAAKALLATVVKWPVEKIHIAQIPDDWFEFAVDIAKEVVEEANAGTALVEQIRNALGAGSSVAGNVPGSGPTSIPAEGPDGTPLSYAGTIPQTTGKATNFGSPRDIKTQGTVHFGDITAKELAAKKNGEQFYCAIRLPYLDFDNYQAGNPRVTGKELRDNRNWWHRRRLLVSNPDTNKGVVVEVRDAGPAKFLKNGQDISDRAIDLSLPGIQVLMPDGKTADVYTTLPRVNVSFAPDGLPTGEVDLSRVASGTAANETSYTTQAEVTTRTDPSATQNIVSSATFVQAAVDFVRKNKVWYKQEIGSARVAAIESDSPQFLDCSSFVGNILYRLTRRYAPGGYNTTTLLRWCKTISVEQGMVTQGAIMLKIGKHCLISLGDGQRAVGAHRTGTVASVRNMRASEWDVALLLPVVDYSHAGPGQQAPIADTSTGAANEVETVARTTRKFGPSTDVVAGSSPIDNIFANVSWNPTSDPAATVRAETLTGIRALLNDEPIYGYVKSLMNSSMRSFCSAPNGDFMAWFPDYYGLWGTAAVMEVEPIELQNFTVTWSDDFFVTHQFVTGANTASFDLNTGVLSTTNPTPDVTTVGIATIDIQAIMKALFGNSWDESLYEDMVATYYQRFGPRPDYQPLVGVHGPKGEFFMALFLFMRQWAYQFNANIEMTFMPELWPGMLLQVKEFAFQAYVTTVTHSFRFGEGGGFTTTVNIASPARLDEKKGALIGLPLSGLAMQGRGEESVAFAPLSPGAGAAPSAPGRPAGGGVRRPGDDI